jgi:hypothetical protein
MLEPVPTGTRRTETHAAVAQGLVLALGAGVAQADNGMLYIGAGLTNDNLRDIAATNSNLNSTNWKVWAGQLLLTSVAAWQQSTQASNCVR